LGPPGAFLGFVFVFSPPFAGGFFSALAGGVGGSGGGVGIGGGVGTFFSTRVKNKGGGWGGGAGSGFKTPPRVGVGLSGPTKKCLVWPKGGGICPLGEFVVRAGAG